MSARLHGSRLVAALGAALAVALAVAGIAAAARMTSTKLGPTLCETTGGGRFVAIPGFPEEMIDRRLLHDIRWLRKRYPIFITDGYSMDDVHAEQGEHPLGLALDIVPDKAAGGRWADITALARWAEPRQNKPRAPFRWVGYDGDEGHGRGNHLHLSWSHSVTRPGRPATLIDTIRCPDAIGAPVPPTEPPVPPPPPPPPPPTGGSPEGTPPAEGRGGHGGHRHADGQRGDRHAGGGHRGDGRHRGHRGGGGGHHVDGRSGGVGDAGRGSGGVSRKLTLAPPVVETGGVGLSD